ncbi:hypothetical protein C8Q77DRAFT_1062417 [Trametes polyzona]|nr:hypothetical protein C8Q77DRAFT_1062417 [Trametes polyzona]
MSLDLDTVDLICGCLDGVSALLSCSLTCHAFREIAARRLLRLRPIILLDERSIRSFFAFLTASPESRSVHVRSLALEVTDIEENHRTEVSGLVVTILRHCSCLESLRIPHGERTFSCLSHPLLVETIANLSQLQALSVEEWSGYTEQILLLTRAPLKTLRVSLRSIWTKGTHYMPSERLDEMIGRFSPTLQVLDIRKRVVRFQTGGVQYPAIRSVHLYGIEGPPSIDALAHMFPYLCDTLDLGDVDDALVDATAEQLRVRRLNKELQASGVRWQKLGVVVGDPLTLYMLGLMCPVERLMINSFCTHLKTGLATILCDTPPTHLKLTILLGHGVSVFEDLFPPEVVPRLTHLVLVVLYDNFGGDDRIDDFTMSSIQWPAFLDMLIDSIKHLRLTHFRLVVYYDIDVADDPATRLIPYSKTFIRNMRSHEPRSLAAALMDAVPSLRYVFLTFGGQFETMVDGPEEHGTVYSTAVVRGRWMQSSGWEPESEAGSGVQRQERQSVKRLAEDKVEMVLGDEKLGLSERDQRTLELHQQWSAEETAPWEPAT